MTWTRAGAYSVALLTELTGELRHFMSAPLIAFPSFLFALLSNSCLIHTRNIYTSAAIYRQVLAHRPSALPRDLIDTLSSATTTTAIPRFSFSSSQLLAHRVKRREASVIKDGQILL